MASFRSPHETSCPGQCNKVFEQLQLQHGLRSLRWILQTVLAVQICFAPAGDRHAFKQSADCERVGVDEIFSFGPGFHIYYIDATGTARPIVFQLGRSEERRVGKECVSPCKSRWLPYP